MHAYDSEEAKKFAGGHDLGRTFRPFQIPLRACRAKDADNLYMAGRNISGDFIAQASYRVTGSSVALGEGVGRALARKFVSIDVVDEQTYYDRMHMFKSMP